MDNDLISRSELKSVLKDECFWCANRDEPCNKSCWHCINEKIDNAPTVEPEKKLFAEIHFDEEQLQEIVDKAKAEVLASVERPQGEFSDDYLVGYFQGCKDTRDKIEKMKKGGTE